MYLCWRDIQSDGLAGSEKTIHQVSTEHGFAAHIVAPPHDCPLLLGLLEWLCRLLLICHLRHRHIVHFGVGNEDILDPIGRPGVALEDHLDPHAPFVVRLPSVVAALEKEICWPTVTYDKDNVALPIWFVLVIWQGSKPTKVNATRPTLRYFYCCCGFPLALPQAFFINDRPWLWLAF